MSSDFYLLCLLGDKGTHSVYFFFFFRFFLFFFYIMSGGTPVTFASVRRMSSGKIAKLNKEQLAAALKDAIATVETPKTSEFTLSAETFQNYLDRAIHRVFFSLWSYQ